MTGEQYDFGPRLGRLQRNSLIVGLAVSLVCVLLAFFQPAQFFRSYLIAYLLWGGVAFGSMTALMIHHLAGGGWGYVVRRILEAATRTWPLVALLAIPILIGIPSLYVWARAEHVAASHALQHKSPYLNVPFFVLRSVFYFVLFGFLAYWLNRTSREQDESADPALSRRLQNISGLGLLFYVVVMSFAIVDWAMSLEPEWYSTIFSAMVLTGQTLSALAFALVILPLVSDREPLSRVSAPKYVRDAGNMMLAFLMLWAYMEFSQFLIIWSGNLTEEIPWYLHRAAGSWEQYSILLAVFHFAVPFVLLLNRPLKQNPRTLAAIALAILVFRLLDMVWTVEPSFDTAGFEFHLLDWLLPVGIGGVWVAAFVRQLRDRPLLPLKDPRLALVLERIDSERVGDVVYGERSASTR